MEAFRLKPTKAQIQDPTRVPDTQQALDKYLINEILVLLLTSSTSCISS